MERTVQFYALGDYMVDHNTLPLAAARVRASYGALFLAAGGLIFLLFAAFGCSSLPGLGGLLANPTPASTPTTGSVAQRTVACVQQSVIPCVHTGGVGATLEACMSLAAVDCAATN